MDMTYLEKESVINPMIDNFYQKALDQVEEGLIIVDNENIVQVVNKSACLLMSYAKEELINLPVNIFYQSFPDTSVEALVHYSGRQAYKPNKIEFEFKMLPLKDGRSMPIEEKVTTLFDSCKKPAGKIIQFKNLTELRETELKSFAYKESYLKFLESRPFLLGRLNSEGQFNYFNQKWLEFTGRSIDDEIYRGWISSIHPDDKQSFEELLKTACSERKNYKTEFRMLNRNGEYRWLICHLNPFNDNTDNYAGYICLCVDITHIKNIEFELMEEQKLSECAIVAKSTFLSNMSHEIRTPLNSIMGLTEVLLDTKLDTEQTKFLKIVKESSHTLLNLLNNILDSARLDENKEKMHECVFSLPEIISTLFNQFQFQAGQKNISLSYKLKRNTPCQLYGDSVKLQRILLNLISNAIKFTDKGFITLNVNPEQISGSRNGVIENVRLHFALADSGIGIPEDKTDMIFDSFTQVDSSSTRSYSGAGLGLTIVKRLTELMHGRIWVDTKLGSGSCFHVVLEFQIPKKSILE